MKFISDKKGGFIRWWHHWRQVRRQRENGVYKCVVAQEPAGWLVIEVQWKDLRHFLKSRPKFNSMPNDGINAQLDFSRVTVHRDMLNHNPAIRIRKGSKSEVVPAIVAGPVDDEVYILFVGKLILAHLERQFMFNLVTWPVSNVLPLLIGGGLFTLWGSIDGWQLHESNDFFSAVALVITITGLMFAIWRLIVQESDKRHDARCRRLEHELMVHQTNQLMTSVGQVQKLLEDHFTSGSPDELTDNMSSGAASGSPSSNSSSTPG